MKEVDSPIFGVVKVLDEKDEEFIKLSELINKYPLNAFQVLNKLLNSKYYCIQMGVLP